MTSLADQINELNARTRAALEAFEREVARTKALADKLQTENEERKRAEKEPVGP